MKSSSAIVLLLATLVLVLYAQAGGFAFVNYDDPTYVLENPNIANGVTAEALVWALTTGYAANWHPLTWVSHMVDVSLYGLDPRGHHLTSVGLHLLNTVLLFLALLRLTGAKGRSAFVAALFAAHPLHVESVAWVAERKDVLSTFFWFLTLDAYARYVERPNSRRFALVVATLGLGLMAKPMLVTVPVVLLLLDAWPLGRLDLAVVDATRVRSLVREKWPLFGLAAASSVITFLVQHSGGAVRSIDALPPARRAANAVLAAFGYIEHMVWPAGLSAFYPLRSGPLPVGRLLVASLLLVAITLVAVRWRQRAPYVAVGWFWYLVTLLPVCGLIQVGGQAMADRYTYVPLIGLFVIVAWGVPDVLPSRRRNDLLLAGCAGLVIVALGACTYVQAGYWRSTGDLFRHARDVSSPNLKAERLLAILEMEQGHTDEAMAQYRRILELRPGDPDVLYDLSRALLDTGQVDQALPLLRELLAGQPRNVPAMNALAEALRRQGHVDEAIVLLQNALEISPHEPEVHNNLGQVLAAMGRVDAAIEHYRAALHVKPKFPLALNNLGAALGQRGDLDGAVRSFQEAAALAPEDAMGHYNLGVTLLLQGRVSAAVPHLREAVRLDPHDADAQAQLAKALAAQ